MAKFQKFDRKQIRGLALAAKALKEEFDRTTGDTSFPYGANAPDEEKPVVQRKKVSKRVQ